MGYARIDADDRVHTLAQRRRVAEIIQVRGKVQHIRPREEDFCIAGTYLLLQAHVLKFIGKATNEINKWDTSISIILVRGVPAPHQSDARSSSLAEPATPI
jgi:hypothetical protein